MPYPSHGVLGTASVRDQITDYTTRAQRIAKCFDSESYCFYS